MLQHRLGDKIDTASSILIESFTVTLVILKLLGGGLLEGGVIIWLRAGRYPGISLHALAKPIIDLSLEFWCLPIYFRQKLFLGLFCIHTPPVITGRLTSGSYRLQKRIN